MSTFIKLNDSANTRVNLEEVVGYAVVITSGSEAINFKLPTNNSGALLDLSVTYDTNADEQVLVDAVYIDHVSGADTRIAQVSVDQT